MDHTPQTEDDAERQRIVTALGEAGFCLPGSVSDERTRCGKASCRCKGDPAVLHGPYHHWTRKIDGKTVGRYLTDEQLERYAGWFANARQTRQLLTELETLSLRIAERTEGWEPQAPPRGRRPRTSAQQHRAPEGKTLSARSRRIGPTTAT
jgi:hypothetical protein